MRSGRPRKSPPAAAPHCPTAGPSGRASRCRVAKRLPDALAERRAEAVWRNAIPSILPWPGSKRNWRPSATTATRRCSWSWPTSCALPASTACRSAPAAAWPTRSSPTARASRRSTRSSTTCSSSASSTRHARDPPDIDLDFCSARRDEVLRYVRDHYGPEHVAMVCTISTMRPQSAVREVGQGVWADRRGDQPAGRDDAGPLASRPTAPRRAHDRRHPARDRGRRASGRSHRPPGGWSARPTTSAFTPAAWSSRPAR